MSLELEQIWSRVQAQLALVVDEPTYRIWLTTLRPVELLGDRLVLEAPPHTCRWIQGRFGRVIEAAAQLVLGPQATVELRAAEAGGDTRSHVPRRSHARLRRRPAGRSATRS